ncbi:putative F0F1-ATPase subunit (Ca2+/Mg2+ transporter) [Chitinophaga polysaccharea]|uniref:AtpZ/AtpI family protein n=2 Tax=Chitinophaga TaxID=79328 RepID=A0A847SLK4_9BACT|nr:MULTISPECIES: AtpZ/AtpI family protein [Chitinophaga]NLR80065.1 AtpZ/AtpI family protein [Chitinophaga eiseniae]TWF39159.1 putative F0F1-ATPase subunit (Ca2+/Mg2+ transporter) [Chitinophaga polysaccharea]
MENPSSRKQNNNDDSRKTLLRYAGLAFQMMATLGLGVFVGYKIDQRIGWRFPVFLIIFSLIALAILLWQIIKDTRRHE